MRASAVPPGPIIGSQPPLVFSLSTFSTAPPSSDLRHIMHSSMNDGLLCRSGQDITNSPCWLFSHSVPFLMAFWICSDVGFGSLNDLPVIFFSAWLFFSFDSAITLSGSTITYIVFCPDFARHFASTFPTSPVLSPTITPPLPICNPLLSSAASKKRISISFCVSLPLFII